MSTMPIYALDNFVPTIASSAYVHPDAVIIGNIRLGENVNIWPQAVLRADYGRIVIGDYSSIHDGSVIHCASNRDTIIGSRVIIGHNAHIEEAVVEDECLIASASVVLNGSVIKKGSIVAAGAVILPGTFVPERTMMRGVPARVRVDYRVPEGVTTSHTDFFAANAQNYVKTLRKID